jgi:transcriptional regulator with XRE-family HTH domain
MTLKDFIAQEMKRRNLTIREFAKEVGVSSSTIVRTMSKNPPQPSLDFLEKLALYTHTDICALVAFIYPNATTVNPNAAIFAARYAALSEQERDLVNRLLKTMGLDKD